MYKKIKSLMLKISIISLFMIMSFAFKQTVSAYSYGTNLLKTSSETTKGTSLINSETIQLSPEDILRANNGDLYYNAYVHLGANGSRTVGRAILVECKNSSGATISAGTYTESGSTYWAMSFS